MKNIYFFCSLAFILYIPFVNANEDQASLLVFDASGSMWGQLKNGRSKIDVAKEVISDYLKDRDQETPLGIIAYGHNRKGDCADIEVLAPVGKQDHTLLAKKLNKITPKGKTPLTDALALAVKQIPKTAESADIILITDGLETCDKDPCALAQKIADEGINIRAHVVGFGLTEKEVNSLSCIPEKTGGHLLRPQSGKELSDALKTVEKSPTEPSTVPSTKLAAEPSLVSLSISLDYEKGSVRPTAIHYSAKNTETKQLIDLGKTEDTTEIVRGFSTTLPTGTWILMAKGPQGEGQLEVSVEAGGVYHIPYRASKADFSLKNYGPYQLGQGQSFLLNIGKPMQKNLTLSAMLFPVDAIDSKQRIDHEYLIGLGKGIREINFKSPQQAGKYKIVIGKSLKEKVASFEIEYVAEAKPLLTVPDRVKPNEKFSYELYGQWYRNNTVFITQQGKKISDQWIQKTIEKDGIYLTAPDKEGIYSVSLRYKDTNGKYVTELLADLVVSEATTSESQEKPETNNVSTQDQTETSSDKAALPFAPVNTFNGDWTLTNLDIEGDSPELLLTTKITQSPKKPEALGEITLITSTLKPKLLGQKKVGEKIQITPHEGDGERPVISLSFKTEKGAYTAQLKYHPTNFDERIEAWGGPLLLNGKEVAVVLFENTTVTKVYEKQTSTDINDTSLSSENTGQTQTDSFPYGEYQGRWILHSQNDQLIRITVQGGKGDAPTGAYFSVYEASESFLGKLMHEDEMVFTQQGKQIALHFSTLKTAYQVLLNQDSGTFFKEVWQGVAPSFERPVWTGYLQGEGSKKIPVYLEKMLEEKSSSTTQKDSFLYDTNNLDELNLVFTCQQTSCVYDDDATKLKGIPLLKDWAIQSPYYYATAAGVTAMTPTILFVHTKTGTWFVLNQRQADSLMFDCLEFGKEGRLSSEEQICSPKNIPNKIVDNRVTLIENIELWRMKSYEEKAEDQTNKQELKESLFTEGEKVN